MICSEPDYEFGLHLYEEGVVTGRIGERAALAYTYGLYLMGGGTPDGFMDMTVFDAQILLTTADGIRTRERNELLKGICTMLGGGTQE